jgi:hypothetical protein
VRDGEKRTAFAAKVVSLYNRGLTMPDKLQSFCTVLARHHFSESPLNVEDQTDIQR